MMLIAHGFAEHSGRYAAVAERLVGERIAVMAADLQEPSGLVQEFFRILREEPYDVGVGTRIGRDDHWSTTLSSWGFWLLFRRLVMPSMPCRMTMSSSA